MIDPKFTQKKKNDTSPFGIRVMIPRGKHHGWPRPNWLHRLEACRSVESELGKHGIR